MLSIRSTARARQPDRISAHHVDTNEGSDPVLLETLGIKSDQSHGINDPRVAQAAKVSVDSRAKRLARHVLAIQPRTALECAD